MCTHNVLKTYIFPPKCLRFQALHCNNHFDVVFTFRINFLIPFLYSICVVVNKKNFCPQNAFPGTICALYGPPQWKSQIIEKKGLGPPPSPWKTWISLGSPSWKLPGCTWMTIVSIGFKLVHLYQKLQLHCFKFVNSILNIPKEVRRGIPS